jgi:type II secretory pathway component PulF
MRCLDVLLQTTRHERLRTVTEQLFDRLEAGESLSPIMADHPDFFSRSYVALVRAGEVGGVLDETMRVVSEWLEQDLEQKRRLRLYVLLYEAVISQRSPEARDPRAVLADLRRELQPLVSLAVFYRSFGIMLGAGVPVIQALETAGAYLGEEEQKAIPAAVQAIREERSIAGPLAEAGLTPPMATQLIAIGEETGRLDDMALRVADVLQAEFDACVLEALSV